MSSDRFWDRAVETLSRRDLEALQLERLRRQLIRCYDESPFYREKYDRARVAVAYLRGQGWLDAPNHSISRVA